MQMKNLKVNMEAVNKVNGRSYVITSVAQDGTSAVLTEVLPEGAENQTADVITMTEANSICFQLVNDPNPKEIPAGYSVNNGIITKGGVPVTQQGEIKVKSILHTVPGALILLVETKDEELSDVMSYLPDEDKFVTVVRNISGCKVKDLEDGLWALYSERTSDVVKTDEDGEPLKDGNGAEIKGIFFDTATITILRGTEVVGSDCLYLPVSDITVAGENLYLVSTEALDEDGFLEDRKGTIDVTVMNLKTDEDDETDISLIRKGEYCIAGAVLTSATKDVYGSYLLKTDESIVYTNEGHRKRVITDKAAVKELEGYDTLVASKIGEYEFKLTIADKSYNVKTVVSTKTRDRGIVVTVQ